MDIKSPEERSRNMAAGIDILAVSTRICQNQELIFGRKNLKRTLKGIMLSGWNGE